VESASSLTGADAGGRRLYCGDTDTARVERGAEPQPLMRRRDLKPVVFVMGDLAGPKESPVFGVEVLGSPRSRPASGLSLGGPSGASSFLTRGVRGEHGIEPRCLSLASLAAVVGSRQHWAVRHSVRRALAVGGRAPVPSQRPPLISQRISNVTSPGPADSRPSPLRTPARRFPQNPSEWLMNPSVLSLSK
jgi:hypothetical protein